MVAMVTVEELVKLAELKLARDKAWKAFNPHEPPSAKNDWPAFTSANAAWLEAYTKAYGSEPETDATSMIANNWFKWYRYDRKGKDEKPPAWIWQVTTVAVVEKKEAA